MRPPAHLWVVVDLDPESEYFVAEFSKRSDARDMCRRVNAIRGYEPTCRVVRYDRASDTKRPDHKETP